MSLPEKANEILKPLGLSGHIVTLKDSPHYHDVNHLYNQSVFQLYKPHWYRNREDLKESDKIYRFSTCVFLHLLSGIRCEYHIHEFYFEGEEYKLSKLFVISTDNEQLDVLGADFENKYVVTAKGNIPFDQLKRYTEESD